MKKATGGQEISLAFDCISEGSTVRNITNILRKNGKVAVVRSKEAGAWDPKGAQETVDIIYGAVWWG